MNELVFDLFGYRFAVRTNDARAAERFETLYAGRQAIHVRPENLFEVRRGDGHESGAWWIRLPDAADRRVPSLADSLGVVEEAICAAVVRHDSGLHGIHGAVVFGPEGDLLISGVSGAGKTTLSLALVARGFGVGGDDATR
jgi:hypothetical protein